MRVIFTVCTTDYAGHLPLWAWSAKRLWPDVSLIALITDAYTPVLICDYLNSIGAKAYGQYDQYPNTTAMSACLRFVYNPPKAEEVLITDSDVVFLHERQWQYMADKKKEIGCYGVFTGAKHKPRRPEIAPNGWVGDMRRLTGTFVLVTPEWYEKTQAARSEWSDRLMRGIWGTFRESDEVMLCRICSQSGLPLPNEVAFAKEMRGLHVGDFRPNMEHRWGNPKRIRKWFPAESVAALREVVKDKGFLNTLEIARENLTVAATWENVFNHLKDRENV